MKTPTDIENEDEVDIIIETARIIEKWEHNDIRINIGASKNEILADEKANFTNALICKSISCILSYHSKDEYTEFQKEVDSFFKNQMTKIHLTSFISAGFATTDKLIIFFKNILYNDDLEPDGINEVNFKSLSNEDSTALDIIFCYYFFYDEVINHIKDIELEALMRIEYIFSRACFMIGLIVRNFDIKGRRENNRTGSSTNSKVNDKKAFILITAKAFFCLDKKIPPRLNYRPHSIANIIQKNLASMKGNDPEWLNEIHPEWFKKNAPEWFEKVSKKKFVDIDFNKDYSDIDIRSTQVIAQIIKSELVSP